MNIKFGHTNVTLLPSGGLFFPEYNIFACADLHLGKGILLQDSGTPMINQLDSSTVACLIKDLQTLTPHYCIICGDLIHARSPNML